MRVSFDQWHLVGKHLNTRDLCHLMQVSKDFFYLWITDRAWIPQRERLCFVFPALRSIFDSYSEEKEALDHTSKRAEQNNSDAKRRKLKKAWSTPKKGIWYIFKKWISMSTDMKGIKELCKHTEMHPLVISVVCWSLPHREWITETKLEEIFYPSEQPRGVYKKYRITVSWGARRYLCYIQNLVDKFEFQRFKINDNGRLYNHDDLYVWPGANEIGLWRMFVHGRVYTRDQWTTHFKKMTNNGEK